MTKQLNRKRTRWLITHQSCAAGKCSSKSLWHVWHSLSFVLHFRLLANVFDVAITYLEPLASHNLAHCWLDILYSTSKDSINAPKYSDLRWKLTASEQGILTVYRQSHRHPVKSYYCGIYSILFFNFAAVITYYSWYLFFSVFCLHIRPV